MKPTYPYRVLPPDPNKLDYYKPKSQVATPTPATDEQAARFLAAVPETYQQHRARVVLGLALGLGFHLKDTMSCHAPDVDPAAGLLIFQGRPYGLGLSGPILADWLKVRVWKTGVTSLLTTVYGGPLGVARLRLDIRLYTKSLDLGPGAVSRFRSWWFLNCSPKNK